ncbi:MAG: diguanylate cyclase, partial [Desulfobacteraceae bacterium]|nr:diguanylate cyclase [Desulfobacteraceae bacterium]
AFETHSSPLYITVSIGFASLDRDKDLSANNLVEMVSQALQKAKKLGRNRVESYKE